MNTALKTLASPTKRTTLCKGRYLQTPYGTISLTWTYSPRYYTWSFEVFATTKLLRRRSLIKSRPHFRRPQVDSRFVRAIASRVLREALVVQSLRSVSTKKKVTRHKRSAVDQQLK